MSLFTPKKESGSSPLQGPLAHHLRPKSLDDFEGIDLLYKKYPILKGQDSLSFILHGPPGCGKTTLARLWSESRSLEFFSFSAVLQGVGELKKLLLRAFEMEAFSGKRSVIFVDEIHRFNKAQQDALLPHVETGEILLIGATTENPRVTVNKALLSRLITILLPGLEDKHIASLLEKAKKQFKNEYYHAEYSKWIVEHAGGDGRRALNFFQTINQWAQRKKSLSHEKDWLELQQSLLENARHHDRDGDRHYDVISAFIKSMRGSDPNAALFWLNIMIEGGEDPLFIARRLIIFASEDVGNADPRALSLATSVFTAVEKVGLPEAGINLAQGVTYLASTVKSNASYIGFKKARTFVRESGQFEVPSHLQGRPPKGAPPYLYPHDYPGAFVPQQYAPITLDNFYRPLDAGQEVFLKKRLEGLEERK